MQAIGPGDWVECVDISARYAVGWGWLPAPTTLSLGAIYQIHSIYSDPAEDNALGIVLVDTPAKDGFAAFAINRFRPIYRPKQSIIDALKQPFGHKTYVPFTRKA